MADIPDFYEQVQLEDEIVDIEYNRNRDGLTGEDFFEVRYRFSSEVASEMREFRENESMRPEFYGVCPFVDESSSPTEVWLSVPIGYDNHQTPLEEVQRVAHGLADLAENYL